MWTAREPGRFIVGVNLPWVGYGTDFGASAWFPSGGLGASPGASERLDRALDVIARDGVSLVRAFLLCDARSGVLFDRGGCPLGIDQALLPDIETMVAACRRHGVSLMPVLIDFHVTDDPRIVNGVQVGGRSMIITNAEARAAFIDRVLEPILRTYAADETIVAWDVMNEPEWCLHQGWPSSRSPVAFDALQTFLGDVAAYLRGRARQPVTVGCAGTWRLDLVASLDLDFYQVHWYPRFGWQALARPVSELGLGDRPVILGEFSGRGDRVSDVLETAKQAGYEGALAWSALSDDRHSAYPATLASWIREHGDTRPRRA